MLIKPNDLSKCQVRETNLPKGQVRLNIYPSARSGQIFTQVFGKGKKLTQVLGKYKISTRSGQVLGPPKILLTQVLGRAKYLPKGQVRPNNLPKC
jgi:hypothetical protein